MAVGIKRAGCAVTGNQLDLPLKKKGRLACVAWTARTTKGSVI